jgi:hypothetical protein
MFVVICEHRDGGENRLLRARPASACKGGSARLAAGAGKRLDQWVLGL